MTETLSRRSSCSITPVAFDPEPTATMLNPVAPGSIWRLEKADADNGQEPKYIESVSIANGQESRLNMP
jgi:hypothetical protein